MDLVESARSDLARWYTLIDHPVQTALITDKVRFKVVPAGRRSGKTERAKRFVVKEAMRTPGPYFVAAPTRDQVKRIYWNDLKKLALTSIYEKKPSETELIVYFPNGSTISLVGLDQPQRIEGVRWSGGIIDEIADTKPDAWPLHIKPSLDTVDPTDPEHRAWAWLIGVPDGLNHYYDLAEQARTCTTGEWKLYTWKSSEILPPDVIEQAKRSLSLKQFKQEYEASFETASGKIYEDYGRENECSSVLEAHERILWAHDFNYTPMSSAIVVNRVGKLHVVDEIVLTSATSRQSALEFVERFKGHANKDVIIYGDPAGRAGEKHGHASDYTEIETVLRAAGWKVERRVKPAAPAVKDRQNAVRARIRSAAGDVGLFVNPTKAQYVHKGLATVQFKQGSTFLEEESDVQHITTAIGYLIDREFPVNGRSTVEVKPVPTLAHWSKVT